MRTSVDDLLATVYRYYPRGMRQYDPGFDETDQTRRLVEARRHAGRAGNPWAALFDRLGRRFSDEDLQNCSVHLPTGSWDAGYVGWLWLPSREPLERHHKVAFYVSFIAPCYTLHSSLRRAATPDASDESCAREIRFTFADDEAPIAQAIEQDILAIFPGYERLPPAITGVVIPDVAVASKPLGEATLFDCLFTEHH